MQVLSIVTTFTKYTLTVKMGNRKAQVIVTKLVINNSNI